MDAWERQRALSRTTVAWSAVSIAGGLLLLLRRNDPWWRAFAQQHIGWGAVDLAIVAVVDQLQNRRMRRLPDPYAPNAVDHERRRLSIILAANAVADAGYCVFGGLLWRRSSRPRAAGAGAAILIQGAFLMVHDSYHAIRSGHGVPTE